MWKTIHLLNGRKKLIATASIAVASNSLVVLRTRLLMACTRCSALQQSSICAGATVGTHNVRDLTSLRIR
jgi:hypothetical protein